MVKYKELLKLIKKISVNNLDISIFFLTFVSQLKNKQYEKVI